MAPINYRWYGAIIMLLKDIKRISTSARKENVRCIITTYEIRFKVYLF